jgi:uncharacterized lipoprotein YajG
MKKILFTLLIILLIAGCAVQKESMGTEKEISESTAQQTAQSADTASSKSISEADDIEELTDTEAEKELDEISGLLDDW